jgi:phenylacetate-CoA ligase
MKSFQDFEDLERLPILTKDILLAHLEELVAENIPRELLHRTATGGSTGRHTPFYRDNKCLAVKWASEWRFHQWTGWDLGEPMGLIWPASQDLNPHPNWKSKLRKATSDRQAMLYAASLSEESMSGFAKTLQRRRIKYLKGFTNAICVFARFCEGRYTFSHLRSVICTGEALLPTQRDLIETALGAKVYNYYCSREIGPIGHQCERRGGLHINEEILHLEIKPDSPASADGSGDLLITDLANFGMPFIRYRIGDRTRLLGSDCACGRRSRQLEQVIGRATDFVISTRGELVHGASLVHYVLALGFDIGQVQFVQRAPGHLVVRLTPVARERGEAWSKLEQTVRRLLGDEIQLEREFVPEIRPEQSGKHRVVVSEISPRESGFAIAGVEG